MLVSYRPLARHVLFPVVSRHPSQSRERRRRRDCLHPAPVSGRVPQVSKLTSRQEGLVRQTPTYGCSSSMDLLRRGARARHRRGHRRALPGRRRGRRAAPRGTRRGGRRGGRARGHVMKEAPAPAADESATRGVFPLARAGAPPTSPSTVTTRSYKHCEEARRRRDPKSINSRPHFVKLGIGVTGSRVIDAKPIQRAAARSRF